MPTLHEGTIIGTAAERGNSQQGDRIFCVNVIDEHGGDNLSAVFLEAKAKAAFTKHTEAGEQRKHSSIHIPALIE